MEKRDDPLLHLRFQINQQISARNQIKFGKGRIIDDILPRKDDRIAQLLADLIVRCVGLDEKSF
ncbi:MAG: hypothetical protein ABI557_17155 [Aureliella sp.]